MSLPIIELAEINKELSKLEEETDNFYFKIHQRGEDLNKIKNKLQLSILKESELLKNSEWRIFVKYSICLALEKDKSLFASKIRNLFETSWHTTIEVSDKLTIDINDNDVIIKSDNLNEIIEFVKSYGLKVNTKLIDDEIERMKNLVSMKTELISELSL